MPFSAPIEPITATDEELRAALDEAELPALLAALVHVTGDVSLLRDDLRLDAMLIQAPQGGLTPEQQEAIRALALDALIRFRDGGCVVAPPPDHDLLCRLMEFAVDGSDMAPYVPILEEELAITGEDLPRAAVAQGRARPRRAVQRGHHRRRHVGPARRAPPPAGRRPVRDHREERRRRRHLVREHLSRVPGRHPEPLLQLLVRAAARLAAVTSRTQDVLLEYFAHCADALRPPPPHPLRHRGASARRSTRPATRGRVELRDGGRHEHARGERGHQRGRPAQPAEAARHPGPRALRRPVVPLGPLGPRRRPARQAGGRDRHRRQRRAVHPRDRAARRPSCGLPAHAALARCPRPSTTTRCRRASTGCCTHVPVLRKWYRFWIFWRTADGVLPTSRRRPGLGAAGPRRSAQLNDMLRAAARRCTCEMAVRRSPDLLDEGRARATRPAASASSSTTACWAGDAASAPNVQLDHGRRSREITERAS